MEAIEDPLSECDVLLAIIHPGWIEDDGLTNSEDVLRIEIERALERELLVVEEFEAKSVTGIIDDMAARLATLEEAEIELTLLALARNAQGEIIELGAEAGRERVKVQQDDADALLKRCGNHIQFTQPDTSAWDAGAVSLAGQWRHWVLFTGRLIERLLPSSSLVRG